MAKAAKGEIREFEISQALQVEPRTSLTRALYPNGRCCKVGIPEIAATRIVHGLQFVINITTLQNKVCN